MLTKRSIFDEERREGEARIKRRLRAHLTQQMGDEIAFEFDVPED